MDRKLMEKLALVGTVCLCAMIVWMDWGAELLLQYLLKHKLVPTAICDFQYIFILVGMGIVLVMVVAVLYICFRHLSDNPEEDEE